MKVQLKADVQEDRVEVGLGPRAYVFVRGSVTEVLASDWPELERQGYFEVLPDAPLPPPVPEKKEKKSTVNSE